jgi:hypothetical protein
VPEGVINIPFPHGLLREILPVDPLFSPCLSRVRTASITATLGAFSPFISTELQDQAFKIPIGFVDEEELLDALLASIITTKHTINNQLSMASSYQYVLRH